MEYKIFMDCLIIAKQTKTFYLTFSDFTYYSQSQIQSAESTKKYSSKFSYVLQWIFVLIYFFNIGKTFSLTYDSIIMFSLYRYLNIEYPEKSEFIL